MEFLLDSDPGIYPIGAEQLNGSAEVLDFILQIADKSWCSPALLSDFVEVLNLACQDRFGTRAQGVFCSMGIDNRVNWKKRTMAVRTK